MGILKSSKAKILINGTPTGYVRYHRGLRQGDLLSPFLFVLVADVLSSMCNHALTSGALLGVPLGNYGRMYHLQYADGLLLVMVGGLEDLRILKLILYLFEGISSLSINFHKKLFILIEL